MVIDPSNGFNSNSAASAGSGKKASQAKAETSAAATEPTTPVTNAAPDNVSLSTTAQNLAKLTAEVASAPDVDSDKVAEIRAELQNGSYDINPDAIAGKMLEQDSLL